jgi:hypothetical protein
VWLVMIHLSSYSGSVETQKSSWSQTRLPWEGER